MPFVIEFIDEGTCALQVGSGIVTLEELLEGPAAVRREQERTGLVTHGLVDLTAVTEVRLTAAEIDRLSNENLRTRRLIPNAAVAIVAPSPAIYGIARMWQALVADSGWKTAVFTDRIEAETWLQGVLKTR